jgi:hypothetical protein
MFAFIRRWRERSQFVWTPTVDFSDRRVAAALMTFSWR